MVELYNQLTGLHLYPKLQELNCINNNNLYKLHVYPKLIKLYCDSSLKGPIIIKNDWDYEIDGNYIRYNKVNEDEKIQIGNLKSYCL